MKILIVDDEEWNRLLLTDVLKTFKNVFKILIDVEIIEASNGIEAIELFRKNHFDLIFMDISMPIINGVETTLKIREINKEMNKAFIPTIIAATAFDINNIVDYNKAEFNYYLRKPIHENELKKCLESVLVTKNNSI